MSITMQAGPRSYFAEYNVIITNKWIGFVLSGVFKRNMWGQVILLHSLGAPLALYSKVVDKFLISDSFWSMKESTDKILTWIAPTLLQNSVGRHGTAGQTAQLPGLWLLPEEGDDLGKSQSQRTQRERRRGLTETSSTGQSSRSRWGSLWIWAFLWNTTAS